jgi:hypothetical protein
MKKYSVVLIALDANDVPATLCITADAAWTPLNIDDVPKMENFRPQRIPDLTIYGSGQQLFAWRFPIVELPPQPE